MTEMKVDNGTPSRHCGKAESHEKHLNTSSKERPFRTYCDGVPPLESFVELTVRASVSELFGEMAPTHAQALHLVAKYGLGMLVDCIGKPETSMVLRVRSGDGKDKVYPLIKRENGVTNAPGVE